MKIGIFGGSFNPPHLGHINLLKTACDTINFDKVFVIPSFISPHKDNAKVSPQDRLNLCKLAFGHIPNITFSDLEIKRSGVSYTILTVNDILKKYPNSQIFLIIGSDMFLSILSWHKAEELLSKVSLVTAPREKSKLSEMKEYAKKLSCDVIFLDIQIIEMSSTFLRKNLSSDYLSENVLNYIRAHNFYDFILKENLSQKRLTHCENVAKMAVRLANHYGEDEDKAYFAGLYHDITKELPENIQLKLLNSYDIMKFGNILDVKKVWHAFTAPPFLIENQITNDPLILDAIRFHTTGRPNMTTLDKIIFIADAISDERDYPDVEKYRKLAFENLDKAFYFALFDIIEKNKKLSNTIASISLDALKFYEL